MKPRTPRLGITAKLLLWCMALILIFYITTTYLFVRINRIVDSSSAIANVHYDIGVAAQRMIQTLLTLEENRKRYEILQKDIYMQYVLDDLEIFNKELSEVLERHPEYREKWEPLTREYTIKLSGGGDPASLLLPDQTVNAWIELLQTSRQENQQEMKDSLNSLYAQARDAAHMGLVGLVVIIAVGVFGTLFIAWRLNRSLREIRRGIREWGRSTDVEPVRVASHDELGELARTFNQMTERLRREEQMRADFISMLSHEIRTPLTSIRESVDLVAGGTFGQVSERQARFLDIARQETLRLSKLLERLMQVSRLEAARMEVRPEPTDPVELCQSALERIRPAARARDIELDFKGLDQDAPPSFPLVTADAENIQQVLLNLLGNAVKFSPPGTTVSLDLALDAARDQAGAGRGSLVFGVSDQGPGIPESEREHVFQKYYREAGVRGTVEGAGLGLFISRAIVEAHGGEMWLADAPGDGSRFCFRLPLASGPLTSGPLTPKEERS